MAWLTVIGPAVAQVDYRLEASAGCGQDHAVDYRMDAGNRLTWFGGGLAEVGIAAGTALQGEADKERARALMDGVHPETGAQLVTPKRAAHPASTLPAAPFLEHAAKAAAERGVPVTELPASGWGREQLAQMSRMVARHGETHRVSVQDLERLAGTAGIDLAAVFEAGELQVARAHRGETVRVGNRGFDLTIDIPKSPSVVWALGDEDTARLLQEAFREAVMETLADVEDWCGYGMRGKNGQGRTARRVETSGLLGWVMWHDVARPVEGQAPDPHLHAHAVIAHMVKGADGKWSTPGNGGREFHRHVETAGALAQARFRAKTSALGFRWERPAGGRVWELAGVPPQARELYSKRAAQSGDKLAELAAERGIDPAQASTRMAKEASALCREGKHTARPLAPAAKASAAAAGGGADLRGSWLAQAEAAELNAAEIVAAARGGGPGDDGGGLSAGGPDGPQPPAPPTPEPEDVAAAVFHPETGLTSNNKVATRPKLLAAVLDELAAGVTDMAEAEALADAVVALKDGPAVELPAAGGRGRGPDYQTHRERYTSADIVAAERTVLAAADRGRYGGLAVVPADTVAMAISEFEVAAGFGLSDEQRAVVERLTGAGHGVEAVVGVAGSGKTTLMAAARTAWRAAGYTVRGATTAAVAAQALAAEAGVPSQTIASLLGAIEDPERPGLEGTDVLVLDEAAMVDDRELARLLTAAEHAGTKVVLIGDPLQLRAIGVGGCFAAVHDRVDGLTLTENRRQRDEVERRALQTWRDGDRSGALHTLGEAGRVHAGDGREDTLAELLAEWATVRADAAFADAHTELNELLVLAGTNDDVDALNAGARAIRRQLGEVTGPDRRYAVAGGRTLALAVGDHVRVRRNDYRTRRKGAPADAVDVLNGYRGVVVGFDGCDVQVQWRRVGADGPVTETATITAARIAAGDLSHGTAMTVAAAQGQTGERALVYGMGLDPHALYPAMSRDRARVDLYLPRALLETDADRARHGHPAGEADELSRAIAAYAATLQGDRADRLITPELDHPSGGQDERQDERQDEPVTQDERAMEIEIEPWNKRRLGALSDTALARLETSYNNEIAYHTRLDQALADERASARRGAGPAAAALTQRRTALQKAARAEAAIARLDQVAVQASQDEHAAVTRASDLRAQLARNPLALRVTGSSRPRLRAQLADAERDRRDAYDRRRAAEDQRRELLPEATAPFPRGGWRPGAAATELADLTGRWDQHRATAIDQDLTSAQARAELIAGGAVRRAAVARTTYTRTFEQAADRLAEVVSEITARRLLPPDRAAREHTDRAAYHAKQRAARDARSQEPYRPGPRYDGPSRDHGISL